MNQDRPILAGKVANPGDPDWVPAPDFVPPPGWPIPAGWRYDPQIGWSKELKNGR